MTALDFIKKYYQIDIVAYLLDDLGFTDTEIMSKLDVSKQFIYNARAKYSPLVAVLEPEQSKTLDKRNKAVQDVIDAFKDNFGTTATSRYDRYAAKRLSDKYGVDDVIKIIQALAMSKGEQYCPVVNNVAELERKMVSVGKFIAGHNVNEVVL